MAPGPDDRVRDDAGGVWIVTGWILGALIYVGVALAWRAGFTPAAPFVVIPVVLAVMIGAGNLIGGRRGSRPAPRFNRPDPVPITSLRPVEPPVASAPTGQGGEVVDTADGSPAGGSGPDR
jgi:hypothetical protein